MDLEVDQCRLRLAQQVVLMTSCQALRVEGVNLDTPEGRDLLRDRVRQQLDSAEIEALQKRIAQAESLAHSAISTT